MNYPPPGPASWTGGPVATTPEERNWAMAAHAGSFLAAYVALGLLAPLVVLLVKGKDSAYVRRHAVESLNFQITALLVAIVGGLLTLLTIGLFGFVLLGYVAFYLVVVILATVRASSGEEFRYPLILRLVS
ncbi:MAG: DUF4870 domain-containing protein [Pseudonocardia sp.]